MNRLEFDELFRSSIRPLSAFAYRRVGADDCEDVVAETLAIAWRKRATITGDPMPWLFKIAANVIRNHQRKVFRLPLFLDAAMADTLAAKPAEFSAGDPDLANAWGELTAFEQLLLTLNVIDELQPRFIAELLGKSANSISVKLHRTKEKLKNLLEDERKAKG